MRTLRALLEGLTGSPEPPPITWGVRVTCAACGSAIGQWTDATLLSEIRRVMQEHAVSHEGGGVIG